MWWSMESIFGEKGKTEENKYVCVRERETER